MHAHNHPHVISPAEWDEIAALPFIREAWGLAATDSGDDLASVCYGAKFDFVTGGPGWAGDLFIIHDDAFGGPPVVLRRDSNRLKPVTYSD
jgi:hypothetical protein